MVYCVKGYLHRNRTCSWNKIALIDADAVAFLLQKRKQFVDNKLPVLVVAALVRQVGVISAITFKSDRIFKACAEMIPSSLADFIC